jgi:uncharacterized protein GlcG (DUF336 family)
MRIRGAIRRAFAAAWTLAAAAAAPAAAQEALSAAEVGQILAQAANEAQLRSAPATIAVVDRVGNVLGVFAMNGAPATARVTSGRGVTGGLEGADVPSTLAAIAKAITGAYLSSGGNAFTTRTANQIVQEHFNPGEIGQPGGPLFGVQFSQLPCSDFSVRFTPGNVNQNIGPKRSPLGLSADPGGLPLYKNRQLVGGVGVMADGVYGLDLRIVDFDSDVDEAIAVAGTSGFAAPTDLRANHITVDGKTLRFTDRPSEQLVSDPASAPGFAAVSGALGALVAVPAYFQGALIAGQAFGTAASGIREDASGVFGTTRAFIFVDGNDQNRFPPRASTDGGLTQAEVIAILREALNVAYRGRAQIRRPLNSHIQVTVSVVDTNGAILGMARTPDAPIFCSDVSLQKARTAAFYSNPNAGDQLSAAGFDSYVQRARALLGGDALANGVAFTDRAGGNLSRPFFPDGNVGAGPGPFSHPFNEWSPFSTGLQLDLVAANIVQHLSFAQGGAATDTGACTPLAPRIQTGAPRIANGIQIFPGSVPAFKNGFLVGGVGVSGDGIDQDDMISFLGTHNAGVALASGVGNAPQELRADRIVANGVRLRYVNCPFRPFLSENTQSPCNGK